MTGEVLRIGPFTGGLNLASDVSSVADEELVVCKNFELDIDGSLKNRPPFEKITGSAPVGHKIIGTAIFGGVGYLFSSGTDSGTQTIKRSTDGITWTTTMTGRLADVAIQYQGKVWFPANNASTASTGSSWEPIGGAVTVAAMPRGRHAVIHKERMYLVPGADAVSNESRLRFSSPADLTTWSGTNFIDVSAGDGETLNAILVYNDNLLLFKDDSVFVLAYDLNPADAILREINPVLGAADGDSVLQFENVVYMLHDAMVYEVVNYDFNPINVKVPFVLDTSTAPGQTRIVDFALSLIGERLVVKYYARMYVFGLRTRTWSEWSVTHDPEELWHDTTRFYKFPNTNNYFSRRAYDNCACVIKVPNNPTVTDAELTGGSFLRMVNTAGASASTPNHASLQITGDLDVRVRVALDDWTTGASQRLAAKFDPTGDQRSWLFTLAATGALQFQRSLDGTAGNTVNYTSTVVPPLVDGTLYWLRVVFDADNGAGGHNVIFYMADGNSDPDEVGWTQIGGIVTTAGVTSIFSGTAPQLVGADSAGTNLPVGDFLEAEIRDGIDGTIATNPKFRTNVSGTTSFTDSTGKVWTINGAASITTNDKYSELITCTMKTKDFDYADPVHFKRLFWWSADILSGEVITGKITPVTYTFSPTWSELPAWNLLGQWGSLLSSPGDIESSIEADSNFALAKTVKFLKSIRFRKIVFQVDLQSDGSSLEPAKLFSLASIVLTKEKIVQKVS